MLKLTRIAFNSADWHHPTGDAAKYESPGTYVHENGFGHDEWLFRSEWQIGGWRYAFLQGVDKSHAKLVKAALPIDLVLFTIEGDKRRRFVANIRGVECLDERQAEAALSTFQQSGWLATMRKEIRVVKGNVAVLGHSTQARHILNIRFRLDNVIKFGPAEFVASGDPIMELDRYQVNDLHKLVLKAPNSHSRRRQGFGSAPTVHTIYRRASAAIQCSPEHARMQTKLMQELQAEYPKAKIVREKNFIDVSVRTSAELLFFEIKSDLDPRVVLRQALGQILEYAFHAQRKHMLPLRLIIVGRCPLTYADQHYLQHLRKEFSLPLEYRVVPL